MVYFNIVQSGHIKACYTTLHHIILYHIITYHIITYIPCYHTLHHISHLNWLRAVRTQRHCLPSVRAYHIIMFSCFTAGISPWVTWILIDSENYKLYRVNGAQTEPTRSANPTHGWALPKLALHGYSSRGMLYRVHGARTKPARSANPIHDRTLSKLAIPRKTSHDKLYHANGAQAKPTRSANPTQGRALLKLTLHGLSSHGCLLGWKNNCLGSRAGVILYRIAIHYLTYYIICDDIR